MKIVSLMLMLISLVMGLSSVSILSLWFFLELNLLSFVLFISLSSVSASHLSMVQYFLVQALGSISLLILLLVSKSISIWSTESMLALLPLGLKFGLPPLHFWYVSFIAESSWDVLLLASSVQKVLPLYMLTIYWLHSFMWLLYMIVVSTYGILLQNWLKKFLAYSSLFTGCWMLSVASSLELSMIYLFIYTLGLWSFMLVMKNKFITTLGGLNTQNFSVSNKVLIFISLLSMAGLPPMIGFLGKVLVISELLKLSYLVALVLTISSVLVLLVYLPLLISMVSHSNSQFLVAIKQDSGSLVICLLLSVLPVMILLLHLGVKHSKFWFFSV